MMHLRRASAVAVLSLLALAPLALAAAGCASGGLVGSLPPVLDPTQAATIVVVRPYSIFGSARTPTITIDGQETYDLGPGEHAVIPVAPGERIVGMRTWEFVTLYKTVKIQAQAGRIYYFLRSGGELSEITEAEGRALMAKTKPLGGQR